MAWCSNSRCPTPASEYRRRNKKRFLKRSRRRICLPRGATAAPDSDFRFVERLVHLMGGRIWVESEEGRGSKFHFTSRCCGEVALEKLRRHRTEERGRFHRGFRAFLSSTTIPSTAICSSACSRWNLKAMVAATRRCAGPDRGIAATGKNFSTILIDKDLPSPGGLALVAAVRASPAADVPMILVHSRLLDAEERDRCKQLG